MISYNFQNVNKHFEINAKTPGTVRESCPETSGQLSRAADIAVSQYFDVESTARPVITLAASETILFVNERSTENSPLPPFTVIIERRPE